MDPSLTELNNRGVAHLEAGDLRGALHYFREVLFQTMGKLRSFGEGEDAAYATTSSTGPIANPAQQHDTSSGKNTEIEGYNSNYFTLSASKKNNPSPVGSKSAIFVHARGITLESAQQAYSTDGLTNLAIAAGIIMFNIAVVYHLKGLEEKCVGLGKLEKAKSYYMKSLSLLSDAGVGARSTQNAIVDFLMMTLLNNMAQVCFELSSYDVSRMHFDRLVRFALTVAPSTYGDMQLASLVDHHKSQFLLNVIILRQPTLASAA